MLGSGGEQAEAPSPVMFAFSLRQSKSVALSVCAGAPVVNAHFLSSCESVGPFLPSVELKPHLGRFWSLNILKGRTCTEKSLWFYPLSLT